MISCTGIWVRLARISIAVASSPTLANSSGNGNSSSPCTAAKVLLDKELVQRVTKSAHFELLMNLLHTLHQTSALTNQLIATLAGGIKIEPGTKKTSRPC